MLASPRHAYILLGLEPDEDLAEGALAEAALKSADVVVALTVFASDALLDCADVLLPIGSFAETPGTYINGEGTWQRVDAAAECAGEARPGWRVLRVLADLFDVENCKFADIDAVRAAIDTELELPDADNRFAAELELQLDPVDVDADALDVPIYSVDPLVRRSKPLQATRVAIERSVSGDTRRKTA